MRTYLDIPITLIVTLTLTVAMLWPLEAPPPAPDGSDKVVHLIAFAALSFPLARTGRFGLLPVFVGASAFGGLIELIQPSFNRSADINDWIADIIGVALGMILIGVIAFVFQQSTRIQGRINVETRAAFMVRAGMERLAADLHGLQLPWEHVNGLGTILRAFPVPEAPWATHWRP